MLHVLFGARARAAVVIGAAIVLAVPHAHAQTAGPAAEAAMSDAEKAARRAALLQQLEAIQAQLRDLGPAPGAPATPPPSTPGAQAAPTPGAPPAGSAIPQVVVTAPSQPTVQERALGQPIDTATREEYKNSPATTAGQVMQNIPGVSIKSGNGPRDTFISVRGSNANSAFGIRNIQMFEDGFPVTQPDGLSRVDDLDPHAIASVDVYKGPSSALFGNYATGGALNFHTRTGADINGWEFGSDAGSFNYFNEYLTYGGHGDQYDYGLFGSHVRGNGFIAHSAFQTTTEDLTGSYAPTLQDKFTFKFINNDLSADLPIRLSYNQYKLNPFQTNCGGAAHAAPGCATVTLLNNGFSGATSPATAQQAGLGRTDRRTIGGMRWEHNIDADTVWRTTATFDDKDINQPTGATSARGAQPAFNLISDVTRQGSLFGLKATEMAGVYFNYVDLNSLTYNLTPAGNATLGGLTAQTFGHDYNFGARGREEIALDPRWTAVGGLAVEYTSLDAHQTLFNYTGAVPATSLIPAYRQYINVAPEAALLYRPDDEWVLRGRVATGYGTPQASNLFVTPQGVNGDNTSLKPQKNVGFDLGTDWSPLRTLTMSVTGFYEFFSNQLVTQSPGAGLQNFTFNAPAAEHRGVETGIDWRPIEDWRLHLVYAYDDQYYTKFVERLSSGRQSTSFSRAHNMIPGVEPNLFLARLAYDRSEGLLGGFGGFLEVYYRDGYFIDNANLLKIPSYEVLNFNLHYSPQLADSSYFRGLSFFFEVDNLLNQNYVASANNVADSISATTGQQNGALTVANSSSIYAGAPRSYFGGMKLKF